MECHRARASTYFAPIYIDFFATNRLYTRLGPQSYKQVSYLRAQCKFYIIFNDHYMFNKNANRLELRSFPKIMHTQCNTHPLYIVSCTHEWAGLCQQQRRHGTNRYRMQFTRQLEGHEEADFYSTCSQSQVVCAFGSSDQGMWISSGWYQSTSKRSRSHFLILLVKYAVIYSSTFIYFVPVPFSLTLSLLAWLSYLARQPWVLLHCVSKVSSPFFAITFPAVNQYLAVT